MARALIKGVSKLLKRGAKKATKKKPTPRYAKKGSQQFLNRRAVLSGAEAATIKAPRKKGYKAGLKEGLTAGAVVGGTGMYMAGRDVASDKAKKTKAKLKKAADKHREEDKKKKKAYGKRAPKKDKNYGGR